MLSLTVFDLLLFCCMGVCLVALIVSCLCLGDCELSCSFDLGFLMHVVILYIFIRNVITLIIMVWVCF